MSFIFALAETSVLLRPEFSLYRAYLAISQRDHSGNKENTLTEEAQLAAQKALTAYARHRVRPGTPDIGYLDEWAKAVRQLPVDISVVEAAYVSLQSMKADPDLQAQAFGILDLATRRRILQAHPDFKPGHGWSKSTT